MSSLVVDVFFVFFFFFVIISLAKLKALGKCSWTFNHPSLGYSLLLLIAAAAAAYDESREKSLLCAFYINLLVVLFWLQKIELIN